MSTVTPHATPKGGFPLVLQTVQSDGDAVSVTFPSASAVEVNRTNLCPIPRPRAGSAWVVTTATGTLGSADAIGVPQQTFAQTDIGKAVATGALTVLDYAAATAPAGGAASTLYQVSSYLYIPASAVSSTVRLDLLSWDGSNVLTPVLGSVVTLPSKGGWWRVTQNATSGGTAAKVGVRINHTSTTVGDTIYWTGAQVETAANAGNAFDGASEPEAAWTGTAFASSSAMTVDPALYKSMRVTTAADTIAPAAT